MATVSKSKLALRFDIKIPPQNIYYPSIWYFVANTTKKKGRVGQHSRNVLRPSSLELATSLLGASRLRREKSFLIKQSRDLLARNLLEPATSFLGARRLRQEKLLAFRKFSAGSHSNLIKIINSNCVADLFEGLVSDFIGMDGAFLKNLVNVIEVLSVFFTTLSNWFKFGFKNIV